MARAFSHQLYARREDGAYGRRNRAMTGNWSDPRLGLVLIDNR